MNIEDFKKIYGGGVECAQIGDDFVIDNPPDLKDELNSPIFIIIEKRSYWRKLSDNDFNNFKNEIISRNILTDEIHIETYYNA